VRFSPDFERSSTLSPARESRQRKPSHFGSYCHSLPRGIASTERASIAAGGADWEDAVFRRASGMAFNANGRLFAGRFQE
jgi:hypothetical protein